MWIQLLQTQRERGADGKIMNERVRDSVSAPSPFSFQPLWEIIAEEKRNETGRRKAGDGVLQEMC